VETDIRFPSAGPSWTPPLDFVDNALDEIDFKDAIDNDPGKLVIDLFVLILIFLHSWWPTRLYCN
jgi:hypothetical protein